MDPNGDGDIEMRELDMAIRMFNRKRAVEKMEGEARRVMRKLMERIEARGMTIQDAFSVMDRSGDGIISGPELMDGLQEICSAQDLNLEPFESRLAKHLSLERGTEVSLEEAGDIVMKARKGDEHCVEVLTEFQDLNEHEAQPSS